MAGGKKPTHTLRFGNKQSGSNVGVAWQWPDGSVTIQLNKGVVLDWHDQEVWKQKLILFPVDGGPKMLRPPEVEGAAEQEAHADGPDRS